jgi:hypothetical protein
MRTSMNFHTAMTRIINAALAIHRRTWGVFRSAPACILRLYSESVSIRSASAKSSSVKPPLLWVDRTKRTLL